MGTKKALTSILLTLIVFTAGTLFSQNLSLDQAKQVANSNVTSLTPAENKNTSVDETKFLETADEWVKQYLSTWKNTSNAVLTKPTASMQIDVLAKGQPDECFHGIGSPLNFYDPQWDNQPINCPAGTLKVNQGYVWGMTKSGDNLWFGTVANMHALVLGGILSNLGITDPIQTSSWVAEYGQSQYPTLAPLPDFLKDWRPPRMFVYDTQNDILSEKTPRQITEPVGYAVLQTTGGIRGAGTLGDVVLMGGPTLAGLVPGVGVGINLFAFHAQTGAFLGATTLAQYNDIRSFLVVYNELYVGVGSNIGGNVLRWIGDVNDPFQFEVVGALDGDAANMAFFENRIFVSTWGLQMFGSGGLSGLWMSPEIAPGGKLEFGDSGNWSKPWQITEYEPDIMTAQSTFGGALAAYDGYLYWGTMNVPLMSLAAHIGAYGIPQDAQGMISAFLGTGRAISIFRGRNFTPGKQVELLYGMVSLPKYTPDDLLNPTAGGSWELVTNGMGAMPLYGPSGFGNFFDTYTWSMAVHQNELFVGTFDWSYLLSDLLIYLGQVMGLPMPDMSLIDGILAPMANFFGADLFRFTSNDLPAFPEDISGVGNYLNYGVRNMISDGDLYMGTANPMNLMTDLADSKPEGGWELLKLSGQPTDPEDILAMLKLFWQNIYLNIYNCCDPSPTLNKWLLAKAAPDECYFGPGDPANNYNPQYGNLPIDCSGGGDPKVNQAYVWGLTSSGDNLWFGTWANGLQQVLGTMSTMIGIDFPPIQTNSWVAEFGASKLSPPLPQGFGDWRPPRMFVFETKTWRLIEKTPPDPLLQITSGIRSAGSLGDVVFFGGPASIIPGAATGINLFAFNAQTGLYLGSTTIPGYNDIRRWLVVNGVLYAGVGTATGGKVLKWTGSLTNLFQFEEVGTLGENAAYLAFHEDRIFVSTWGGQGFGVPTASGIWMSPTLNGGSLTTGDAGNWQKVWSITDYEPDLVTAHVTLGGALASFDGYLYWGTMHVPAMAAIGHFMTYGLPQQNPLEIVAPVIGTYRSISLFRGNNFGTPGETQEVLYGMPMLPAYNPVSGTWQIVPNGMGNPLYGLSGFGNIFNNYTWSMEVFNDQLFVGTMDFSYLGPDLIHSTIQMVLDGLNFQQPIDPALITQIAGFFHNIDCFFGADLWRFPSSALPAVPEDATGVGNITNYGVRNMVVIGNNNPLNLKKSTGSTNTGLVLGMANPMNLLTDPYGIFPHQGGWELKLLALDVDKDRIPDFTDGDNDRDGDGIINFLDYDPTGYFYNEATGEIVAGGNISVTGPGPVVIAYDGSNGYYEWYITLPGVYTIHVTLPAGYIWSQTCLPQTGPFDPTNQGQNPVVLGNGENASTGFLTSNACTNFYFDFDLALTDPVVINNNFPLTKQEPTNIVLSSFAAAVENNSVILNWVTETEPDNAGFNVFRSQHETNDFVQVNSSLIPANGDAFSGATYEYTDQITETGAYYYKIQAISLQDIRSFYGPITVSVSSVDINKSAIPDKHYLSQNYPNPFNPETTIEFGLPEAGFVEISIFDINGKLVRKLVSEEKHAGNHWIKWDARDESGNQVSSGVYFYQVKVGDSGAGFQQTNKMILMK